MSRGVVVLGAGGHAKVVVATLQASGRRVLAVLDDDPARRGATVLGVEVRGPLAALDDFPDCRVLAAVGDNRGRRRVATEAAGRRPVDWATVVHPAATVHPSVVLGPGTVVFAGAVVQPDARLGAHVIVNTAASIDHDCTVGDYGHVAPGAHLTGGVTVGEGALVGAGAVVLPGREVGAWATLGSGGALARDLGPEETAVGVPARRRTEAGP